MITHTHTHTLTPSHSHSHSHTHTHTHTHTQTAIGAKSLIEKQQSSIEKLAPRNTHTSFLDTPPKDKCTSWTIKIPPFGGVTQTHCESGKKSLETCIGVPHIYEDCSKITTNTDGTKTYTDITHAGPMTYTFEWDIPKPPSTSSYIPQIPCDLGPVGQTSTNMFNDPTSPFNVMSPSFTNPSFNFGF